MDLIPDLLFILILLSIAVLLFTFLFVIRDASRSGAVLIAIDLIELSQPVLCDHALFLILVIEVHAQLFQLLVVHHVELVQDALLSIAGLGSTAIYLGKSIIVFTLEGGSWPP